MNRWGYSRGVSFFPGLVAPGILHSFDQWCTSNALHKSISLHHVLWNWEQMLLLAKHQVHFLHFIYAGCINVARTHLSASEVLKPAGACVKITSPSGRVLIYRAGSDVCVGCESSCTCVTFCCSQPELCQPVWACYHLIHTEEATLLTRTSAYVTHKVVCHI